MKEYEYYSEPLDCWRTLDSRDYQRALGMGKQIREVLSTEAKYKNAFSILANGLWNWEDFQKATGESEQVCKELLSLKEGVV